MKVVFLDIDGVLNNHTWWTEVMSKYNIDTNMIYNQEAMFLLRQLVDLTGARIVLSSSWRISEYSRDKVMDNFIPYGLSIYSCTGEEPGTRGHQILEWLRRHPDVDNYVAFDDDEDLTELGYHFIKTNYAYGLQREHFSRALEILTEASYDSTK